MKEITKRIPESIVILHALRASEPFMQQRSKCCKDSHRFSLVIFIVQFYKEYLSSQQVKTNNTKTTSQRPISTHKSNNNLENVRRSAALLCPDMQFFQPCKQFP